MKKLVSILLFAALLSCSLTAPLAAEPLKITSVSRTAGENGLHNVSVTVDAGAANQEITLLVLGNENNGVSPQLTIDSTTGYVYYIAQENTGESNTYTFVFSMEIPESMKDIEDYIYVYSGSPAADKIMSQLTGFNHGVSLDIGANGKIKVKGQEYGTGTASIRAVDGELLTLDILPDSGYVVDEIYINEVPTPVLTSFAVTEDTTVKITFKEDTRNPEILSCENVFFTDSSSITFGTYTSLNNAWEITGYGIVYSATVSVPELGMDGCFDLTAREEANAKGQYGIEVMGADESYYARTYVKASKDGGTEQIFYGDVITVQR